MNCTFPACRCEMPATCTLEKTVTDANYDEVICPNCVHQFRAIPVNVQDELRRLSHHEAANVEWMEKTAWLQPQPKELGKHRADVLRDRLAALEAENVEIRKDAARYRWLRELPNADSLNVTYMGADLDLVIDAALKETP